MYLLKQILNIQIMAYDKMTMYCFVIIGLLLQFTTALYSIHYRKCLLNNLSGTDVGHTEIQRLPIIRDHYIYQPKVYYRKPLKYLNDVQFIYHDFLGSGASGQVYLIEHISSDPQNSKRTISTPKVIKRFFEERIRQFEEENYIMTKLGYPIQWTMEMDPQQFTGDQTISYITVDHATIAMYPYYTSTIMRDADIDSFDVRITIYKLCKQVQKAHQNGIIHSDLKLGNILMKIPDPNMDKLFDVQLIDWNLAAFYYPGYYNPSKKGTPCYYSPEMLLRAGYITPQTDIFSLGVLIFYYLTDKKPFELKCSGDKNNNIQSITSLVGLQNILDMMAKYRYFQATQVKRTMNKMLTQPDKYQGKSLVDLVPKDRAKYFNEYLIDLLQKMLIPDPQLRITAAQILEHQYFIRATSLPPMFYQKAKSKKKGSQIINSDMQMDLETLKQKVKLYKKQLKSKKNDERQSLRNTLSTKSVNEKNKQKH